MSIDAVTPLQADFKAKFGCEMGFNPVALGKSFGFYLSVPLQLSP